MGYLARLGLFPFQSTAVRLALIRAWLGRSLVAIVTFYKAVVANTDSPLHSKTLTKFRPWKKHLLKLILEKERVGSCVQVPFVMVAPATGCGGTQRPTFLPNWPILLITIKMWFLWGLKENQRNNDWDNHYSTKSLFDNKLRGNFFFYFQWKVKMRPLWGKKEGKQGKGAASR